VTPTAGRRRAATGSGSSAASNVQLRHGHCSATTLPRLPGPPPANAERRGVLFRLPPEVPPREARLTRDKRRPGPAGQHWAGVERASRPWVACPPSGREPRRAPAPTPVAGPRRPGPGAGPGGRPRAAVGPARADRVPGRSDPPDCFASVGPPPPSTRARSLFRNGEPFSATRRPRRSWPTLYSLARRNPGWWRRRRSGFPRPRCWAGAPLTAGTVVRSNYSDLGTTLRPRPCVFDASPGARRCGDGPRAHRWRAVPHLQRRCYPVRVRRVTLQLVDPPTPQTTRWRESWGTD